MDDPFFTAAQDIDKMLDELEKQESSKQVRSTFSSAVQPNTHHHNLITSHVVVDASNSAPMNNELKVQDNLDNNNDDNDTKKFYEYKENEENSPNHNASCLSPTTDSEDMENTTTCAETGQYCTESNVLVDLGDCYNNQYCVDSTLELAGMSGDTFPSKSQVSIHDSSSSMPMTMNQDSNSVNEISPESMESCDAQDFVTCSNKEFADAQEDEPAPSSSSAPAQSTSTLSLGFDTEFQVNNEEFESFMSESSPPVEGQKVQESEETHQPHNSNQRQPPDIQSSSNHDDPVPFFNENISLIIKEYFPDSDDSCHEDDNLTLLSAASNCSMAVNVQAEDTESFSATPPEAAVDYFDTTPVPVEMISPAPHEVHQETMPIDDTQPATNDDTLERNLDTTTEYEADIPGPSHSYVAPSPIMVRPGAVKPVWVPDEDTTNCSNCGDRFTFTRRRHHCRACGKIFCNACCNSKSRLEYLLYEEARVCITCMHSITEVDEHTMNQVVNSSPTGLPTQPQSILHSSPGSGAASAGKLVRFSDGTRPDHPEVTPNTPPLPEKLVAMKKPEKQTNLPGIIKDVNETGVVAVYDPKKVSHVSERLFSDERPPLIFALSPNLFVSLRIVTYHSLPCYYFLSSGLVNLGQCDVGVLFEMEAGVAEACLSELFLVQIFKFYAHLFNSSRKGKFFQPMQFVPDTNFLPDGTDMLGNCDNAGFLLVKLSGHDVGPLVYENSGKLALMCSQTATFQSTLFALVVRESEVSLASLFPNRLLLGLGVDLQECPYPIRNKLSRSTAYPVLSNSILTILCDFRTRKYRVMTIPGLIVLIDGPKVTIDIPNNRLNDIMSVMRTSNDHVLALGASSMYSPDHSSSCLACVQNPTDFSYRTEVLQNHKQHGSGGGATCAAFVILNGSLKTGDRYRVKSSTVEDGVMVELLPETIDRLKTCIKARQDFNIENESRSDDSEEEDRFISQSVSIRWTGDDQEFNVGIRSCVDFRSLQGVIGYNVNKSEKKTKNFVLRWNQVFCFRSAISGSEVAGFAELIGSTASQALLPHLQVLRAANQTKFAIRANIHREDVGYSAGSNGEPLPNACLDSLDSYLIPLLDNSSSKLSADDDPVEFEMVFAILEIHHSWKYCEE